MAEAEWQKRHREIEELHRTIQARMDERDRRAAEREKGHEKRREELRARLAAYGLREVSSDELLASTKRLSKTVDRVLEARQRSAGTGSMAEAEWKGRVDRLDEVTIVQARILERLEQKYDDAIRRHDEELAELRRSQIALHEEHKRTEQSLQIMSAGIHALRETVDRFIRGQEGNGRKQ